MADGLATVHHDYEGSFTAEKVDKKLKEGVYGKGLDHWSVEWYKRLGYL